MCGIPEISQTKVLQLVTLSRAFCLMLAVQSLGVWRADFSKEPLPSTGAWELTFVLALSCVAAALAGEILKRVLRCVRTVCCSTRKSHQLQRLREMARLTAEAELDRAMDLASDAEVQQARSSVTQAVSATPRKQPTTAAVASQTDEGWQVERVRDVPREVVVYRDVPRDVPVPMPGRRLDRVYMSEHGGHVHIDGDCRGFRMASSRVKTYEFCDFCSAKHSITVRDRPRRGM